MTGRGRNYSQSNEWDSTRDDYNSSVYDAQYPDEDASGGVNLDHCRLYIKNIPKGLNEEGLKAAFSKFGTLHEVFLSKDPQKNYGLVRFETPGEAKLAMMKMNRTEPLRLLINIAHKSKKGTDNRQNRDSRDWQDRNTNEKRERDRMSLSNRDREDSGSVISRGRNSRIQEEIPNGDNNMDELMMEDDYGFSDILDPNLHLELESLKLEQLKVREEQLQCKQRVILLKQAERRPMSQMSSNRCILPDGKIVIRSVNDRDSRDADVSFSAGAGDSLNLPGLQRIAAKQCVGCGSPADAFCAGCGLTPYCSELCQKKDWTERHSNVCHNLARKYGDSARNRGFVDNEPKRQNDNTRISRDFIDNEPRPAAAPAQLRRPHALNGNRREQDKDEYVPQQQKFGNKNDRFNRFQDKPKQQQSFKPKVEEIDIPEPAKVSPKKEPPQNRNPMFNKTQPKSPAASVNIPVKTPVVEEPKQNLVPKSPIPENLDQKTPEVSSVAKQKPASASIKPASVSDVTPTTKLIPKQYLIEKLSIGDTLILSVETKASESRSNRGDYVCLSMSERFELPYQSLCEDFVIDCDKDDTPHKLVPGETCSYFNPEDGGWYRARCLTPTSLALLDSGRVVSVTPADKCRKLPSKYEAIPEFCCVLLANNVEVGSNLSCNLLSQTADSYKISMTDVDTGAAVGEGEVFRWLPTVEYQAVPLIPEVERPEVRHESRVVLVVCAGAARALVRPAGAHAQRLYNDVLQRVLLSAMKAKPLEDPPRKGEMVIAQYEDGNHYRALCRRTNVKQNKYQIEYVEYGNIEVTTLEKLYPCPSELDLTSIPTVVSAVKLGDLTTLSTAATELVETLKDEEELILTLQNGQKTAPSGSVATLTIAKNKVNLNKKLLEMCTPEWKKIEERGGDVVETENIMFDRVVYAVLPSSCTLQVLDISVLRGGVLSGHDSSDATAHAVFHDLTDKMAEYCNSGLGKEPYLPKPEELCIAQLPPYPQWFRAVFLQMEGGPGSSEARVCYLDYGNLANVPVSVIRKMMPEFLHTYPALGLHVEIRGFPSEPTDEQLARALEHMKIDDEGRGTLRVSNCVRQSDGMYQVDAPELLKAMKG